MVTVKTISTMLTTQDHEFTLKFIATDAKGAASTAMDVTVTVVRDLSVKSSYYVIILYTLTMHPLYTFITIFTPLNTLYTPYIRLIYALNTPLHDR